ncbi:uncharacterized protein BDW70DRAFT_162776 [Aspergillus foveolatus]|uniref:uncharacterized protein n=1 Tax=Aspergillus foveolatus TaxID=210207 RepID=UPI003CCE35FB
MSSGYGYDAELWHFAQQLYPDLPPIEAYLAFHRDYVAPMVGPVINGTLTLAEIKSGNKIKRAPWVNRTPFPDDVDMAAGASVSGESVKNIPKGITDNAVSAASAGSGPTESLFDRINYLECWNTALQMIQTAQAQHMIKALNVIAEISGTGIASPRRAQIKEPLHFPEDLYPLQIEGLKHGGKDQVELNLPAAPAGLLHGITNTLDPNNWNKIARGTSQAVTLPAVGWGVNGACLATSLRIGSLTPLGPLLAMPLWIISTSMAMDKSAPVIYETTHEALREEDPRVLGSRERLHRPQQGFKDDVYQER